MTNRRWQNFELLGVAILALFSRFWDLFTPHAVVFDEVYFKQYAGDYLTGNYYFDIHPPLGKLILAGYAYLTHLSGPALIGSDPAVTLRVIPALAGALIIPVFYYFLRELKSSHKVALLGAILLLLENGLLVESRLVLIDSMLILFGLSAVTLYLASRRSHGSKRTWYLLASLLLAGMAASTKWTGLTALGLIGVIWLADTFKALRSRPRNLTWLGEGTLIVLIPMVVYLVTFWIHFSFLPKTGPGDAFMPSRFQETLVGNSSYNPNVHLSLWDKFIDLNVAMRQSEDSLKHTTHPYGSAWYTWPVLERPIYYWAGDTLSNGKQGNIYLLGNPIIWWGVIAGIFAVLAAANSGVRNRLRPYRWALVLLGLGYGMNFLPFSQIQRVMFLYHYFFALIYSLAFALIGIGALCGWMDESGGRWHFISNRSRFLYIGIIAIAVLGFAYFSPLSYGWALSPNDLAQHMWLKTWR